MTQLAIPGADLKCDSPLTEEHAIGFQQFDRGIVDVGSLSGHPVELEDFKSTVLKLFDRFCPDVESPKMEARELSSDRVDRGPQSRRLEFGAVEKNCAPAV